MAAPAIAMASRPDGHKWMRWSRHWLIHRIQSADKVAALAAAHAPTANGLIRPGRAIPKRIESCSQNVHRAGADSNDYGSRAPQFGLLIARDHSGVSQSKLRRRIGQLSTSRQAGVVYSAARYSRADRKFFTSPAIRLLKPLASKSVIGPIPLSPASSDLQNAFSPVPLGASTPIPVTTTRLRLRIILFPEKLRES